MSRILKCPSGHERKIPEDWARDTASCNYCDHVFRLHDPLPRAAPPAPRKAAPVKARPAPAPVAVVTPAAPAPRPGPKIKPLRCPFCEAVELPEVRSGFALGFALVAIMFTAPIAGALSAFPIMVFLHSGSLLGAFILGCFVPGAPAALAMFMLIGYSMGESAYHCRSCGSRIAVAA